MKTDPRRFAPLGLVLALLAVLSLVVILLIKGLATTGIFTPPDPKLLDQGVWISAAVIVLGLALTAFLDPEGTRKFFVGRQVQYGSNSVITLIAFLGILFFINLMAYQNPMTKDVTEGQENSLAPETLNIINALPQPVTVRGYYSSQLPKDTVQKLLDNFKRNSNGKLSYQFINPEIDPISARSDGISSDGTLVLRMADRKELVTSATEQDIDAAIVRLINPEQRVVYFLTGHGEHDTEKPENTSFSQIKAALQNKNYTVKLLNLGGGQAVPDDAKVVVIAGPQQPLTASEVAVLETYAGKGGALIVMEDPLALTKAGNAPDPLADMLTKWGITLENDLIVDPNVSNSLFALADPQNYGSHPISDKLQGYNFAFYTARSLKLATASTPENITLTPLAQTLPNAWGETTPGDTASFDPATDIQGPLVIAAAAENSATKARLVVFGDSDFATDTNYKQGFGGILINAVDWDAEQENLINLTPKNSVARTFDPPSTTSLLVIILLSICVIPLLVVAAGVAAWYSRRRRG